jgi:hypothetical protein
MHFNSIFFNKKQEEFVIKNRENCYAKSNWMKDMNGKFLCQQMKK